MSDTIDKLKAIVQKADFTDEQKEGYLQSLDGLSKVKVPKINEALAQLLPEAEKNPAKIREFMWAWQRSCWPTSRAAKPVSSSCSSSRLPLPRASDAFLNFLTDAERLLQGAAFGIIDTVH